MNEMDPTGGGGQTRSDMDPNMTDKIQGGHEREDPTQSRHTVPEANKTSAPRLTRPKHPD